MPAKKKKSNQPQTNYQIGNVDGMIVNVGGEQTISGSTILNLQSHWENVRQNLADWPKANQTAHDELLELVNQLKEQLDKAPQDRAAEVKQVAKRVEALVKEAKESKPDKAIVQVTGDSLKKAAENLATVMPSVLVIATQIVNHILQIVR